MFRIIAIFFFFFSLLIDLQFVSSTLPHYGTRNYVATHATVLENSIQKVGNREIYSANIVYNYSVGNNNYTAHKIQIEDKLFNEKYKAEEYLKDYSVGKRVFAYYEPNNAAVSYLEKGLTNKDWNTLVMLLPINITSLLVLYLGFILRWNFNQRNRALSPFAAGLLGNLVAGVPCSLLLIFGFQLEASQSMLNFVLVCNGLGFLSFMLFKKATRQTMHRYQRVQTVDYSLTLREGHDYTVRGINKLKRDGFLPIVMIDSLLGMAMIFSWAKNQFILDNTVAILFVLALLITALYLYSLTTKPTYNHHHSFTGRH